MRLAVALLVATGCTGEILPVDLPRQVDFEVEAQRIPGAMHRVRNGPVTPLAVGGSPDPFLLERDPTGAVWIPALLPDGWRGTVRDASTTGEHVFLSGDEGQLAQGRLGQLERLDAPVTGSIPGVFADAADDVYFAAEGGLLHFDGEVVARVPLTASATPDLLSVWGSGGTVFAVGEGGVAVLHSSTGTAFTDTGTVVTLRAVHGRSSREAYAVGGDREGAVLRWDGSGWSDMASADMPPLHDVFAGSGALYVVGDAGYLARHAGEVWEVIETPATIALTGLLETSAGLFLTGGNVVDPSASGFVMLYRP